MNVLVLYAHPEPASFNAALKEASLAAIRAAGHTAEVSDLYAENFNPVAGRHDFTTVADPGTFHYQTEQAHAAAHDGFSPELKREQGRVARADAFLLHFPLWWGGPPAILKGWFDRVMAFGFAYRDGTRFDTGLYRGKRGMLCVTTGGTTERFSEAGVYGPVEKVLWPTQRLMLEYMGLEVQPPFIAYAAPRVDEGQRLRYLEDWTSAVGTMLAKTT